MTGACFYPQPAIAAPTVGTADTKFWSRSSRLTVAAFLLVAALTGCTATSQDAGPGSSATTTAPVPTGTIGATRFDDGFVQIGHGAKVVDLFIDPMCPYCKLFEETSGPALFKEAAAGKATVRVYPIAILNRLSQGTAYSTRAAAMLTAVAAEHPRQARAFLQALYEAQPSENTTGLTDEQLQQLTSDIGAEIHLTGIQLTAYRNWVNQHTAAAMTGPVSATNRLPAISQVPTVIINGAMFPGNIDDTAAFTDFYNMH